MLVFLKGMEQAVTWVQDCTFAQQLFLWETFRSIHFSRTLHVDGGQKGRKSGGEAVGVRRLS
jgi:hypothetical protein